MRTETFKGRNGGGESPLIPDRGSQDSNRPQTAVKRNKSSMGSTNKRLNGPASVTNRKTNRKRSEAPNTMPR